MASDKRPSIYSDRGTIGSSDELDEYGVWVKSEPQDLSAVNIENQDSSELSAVVMDELPGFDADFGEEDSSGFAQDDFQIPDLDIPDEPLDPAPGSLDEEAGEALDFDDLSIPEENAALPAVDDDFTEVDMEDFLDGTPEILTEPAAAGEEPAAGPESQEKQSGGTDLSTQLLMKIADELSSIRNELSTLKKEFSAIRKEVSVEDKSEAQKKGFFDEEEDEKIALTGDELDNILNTADFTEEAGADATEELPGVYPSMETGDLIPSDSTQIIEESALPDLLSDQDDIIDAEPETELQAEEPALLEFETDDEEHAQEDDIVIDLDFDSIDPEALTKESPGEPEPSPDDTIALDTEELDDTIALDTEEFDISLDSPADAAGEPEESLTLPDETEELRVLREEGVKPMTPPPEDTRYLDEEAAEETSMDISLDDFSMDDLAVEDAVPAESGVDENILDLSNAVIEEPDLSGEITENPLLEPSLDEFSLNEGVEEDTGTEETGENKEADNISIDLDFENIPAEGFPEDKPAEDGGEEPELSLPEEEETISLDMPEDISAPELSLPGEEDFAPVIPEGFVVESGDSQAPLEDDIEEIEEDVLSEDVLSEGDIDTLEKSSQALELDKPGGEDALTIEPVLSDDESLNLPNNIKQELKTVLSYMDQLLESLPEDKIEEFAKSEYFDTYKKLFKELGLD
jgi:hypothetical protein